MVVSLVVEMKVSGVVADRVVHNVMTACFCKDEGYPSAAFAVLDDIYKSWGRVSVVSYTRW